MATAIAEIRHIGMLTVDSTEMKNLLIPNPLRCLEVRKVTQLYDYRSKCYKLNHQTQTCIYLAKMSTVPNVKTVKFNSSYLQEGFSCSCGSLLKNLL